MTGVDRHWGRSLEETPTWALAAVWSVFVIISVLIERAIHLVGNRLRRSNQTALYEVLGRIKSELLMLGLLCLLLTIGQKPVAITCISESWVGSMLPCTQRHPYKFEESSVGHRNRKLLGQLAGHPTFSLAVNMPFSRRILSAHDGSDHCVQKGMAPLVTQNGIHQLQIFIFVFTIVHVFYSVQTIGLGRAKTRSWKAWEEETKTEVYPEERIGYSSEISFAGSRVNDSVGKTILIWTVCFFRQFFMSVPKTDYWNLRNGYILAHLGSQFNKKLDFHKYIQRTLEDDLQNVVGISPPIWIFSVIYLLLNVYGWYTSVWISFIPLIVILAVGTKLQFMITKIASEFRHRHTVAIRAPVAFSSNERFWLHRPHFIVFLIHFTLFQNAFQLAFFIWTWCEFGISTCFHGFRHFVFIRIITGVGTQFLCSYVTLPLYALVAQISSHMKKITLEEHTANLPERQESDGANNSSQDGKSDLHFEFTTKDINLKDQLQNSTSLANAKAPETSTEQDHHEIKYEKSECMDL